MSKFLILSVKHSTKDEGSLLKWWGPWKRGYVERLADAGRYNFEDAEAIVAGEVPGGQSSVMVSLDNGGLFLKGDMMKEAVADSTHDLEMLGALEIWKSYHGD